MEGEGASGTEESHRAIGLVKPQLVRLQFASHRLLAGKKDWLDTISGKPTALAADRKTLRKQTPLAPSALVFFAIRLS